MSCEAPHHSIKAGPFVQWDHPDGPLMFWAGQIHWMTWVERLRVMCRLATVDEIACERWPHTAGLRRKLMQSSKPEGSK